MSRLKKTGTRAANFDKTDFTMRRYILPIFHVGRCFIDRAACAPLRNGSVASRPPVLREK